MESESIRLMIFDVNRELLGLAKASKVTALESNSDYDKGRQFAFYEVVSLLMQQAENFEIDKAAIGLEAIDPERDIL